MALYDCSLYYATGKLPKGNAVVLLKAYAPDGFESVGDFLSILLRVSCPKNKMSRP